MKNKISILIISFLSIIFVVYPLFGQAASVGFLEVMDITEAGARIKASASCGSSPGCTDWGFEWGTSPGSYTESSWLSGSARTGFFTFDKALTNLSPETTYYFRAGAKDENGWGYSSEKFFTTTVSSSPLPCEYHNVWGWAWSENVGWISFSCRNTKAEGTGIDYGVDICESETDPRCDAIASPKTGKFIGYAWSRGTDTDPGGIGWISFNRSETGAPPFDDVCSDGSCLAKLDFGTGEVSGWAKTAIVEEKLYESYVIDYDAQFLWRDSLSGLEWQGQTFTVGATGTNETHKVTRISLFLYNVSISTETLVVSIQPSTLDNTDLCIGTKTIAPGSGGIYEWYDIFLEDNVEGGCILSPNTQYFIVARCPDCDGYINWGNYVFGSYTGGRDHKSDDGGNFWGIDSLPNEDFRFKIWGMPPGGMFGFGGWDGWIKLRGTVQSDGSSYGVYLDSSGYKSLGYSEFREWAWGGDDTVEEAVVGWISFNRLNCDTDGEGSSDGDGACPVSGTDISDYKVMTNIKVNSPPTAIDLNVNGETGDIYCFASSPPIRLSWTFDDLDLGDTQSAYQIEIHGNSNYTSLVLDSGEVSTLYSPPYTYAPPNLSFGAKYYWRLKVWDSEDKSSIDWIYPNPAFFTIDPRWPKPSFTWDPVNPLVEQEIQFDGSVDYCSSCSYLWDFGDAVGTSILQDPIYTYDLKDSYTVKFTATSGGVRSCDVSQTVNVEESLSLPIWKEIPPF